MTRMLGAFAWQRSKKCKSIGCCVRPRRSKTAQRLYEGRSWRRDAVAETVPERDEWVDLSIAYAYARMGLRAPAFDELQEGDCDRFGCSGSCLRTGGSGHCRILQEEGA